jgi:hypothetical protein
MRIYRNNFGLQSVKTKINPSPKQYNFNMVRLAIFKYEKFLDLFFNKSLISHGSFCLIQ